MQDKKQFIKDVFNTYQINLNENQIDMFLSYFNFLVEENEKYNLTAITNFEDVVYKHFLDSVLPYKELKTNSTIVDVGSGAGFPGIPLKILRPDLNITLIDSLQKRVNFLNETISLLKLKNIKAIHTRVEDFCLQNREKFDYAVSRAVAQIPTLAEYLLPLLKIEGNVFMYKSQKLEEEINIGQNAIKILGGKICDIKSFYIKEIDAERKILIINKIKSTPKIYPRGKNLPKTKPLI